MADLPESDTTYPFQSLIGIIEDFDFAPEVSMLLKFPQFQSLIGIIEDFDLPHHPGFREWESFNP